MEIEKTKLSGAFVITPRVFEDDRGYFFESYNKQSFDAIDAPCDFVPDNQSFSSYGTVRGLHLQVGEFAQAKLVRCIAGRVLDVIVDVRKDSPTFGQHISVELSAENQKQLFVPRGFAHGFSTLSETATFLYKVDNYYSKESERGIIYNDSDLGIDWQLPEEKAFVSDKDSKLSSFKEFKERL